MGERERGRDDENVHSPSGRMVGPTVPFLAFLRVTIPSPLRSFSVFFFALSSVHLSNLTSGAKWAPLFTPRRRIFDCDILLYQRSFEAHR